MALRGTLISKLTFQFSSRSTVSGPSGADAAAGGVDPYRRDQAPGVGVGVRGRLDLAPDDHVAAIPAVDADAAVAAGVDVERVGAADGVLTDLAMGGAVVVVAAVVARHGGGPCRVAVAGLRRAPGHEGGGDGDGDNRGAEHQASSVRLDGTAPADVYCRPGGPDIHSTAGERTMMQAADHAHVDGGGPAGGRRRTGRCRRHRRPRDARLRRLERREDSLRDHGIGAAGGDDPRLPRLLVHLARSRWRGWPIASRSSRSISAATT